MSKPVIIAKGPDIISTTTKKENYQDADFRKVDSAEKVGKLRNDIAQNIEDFGYVKLIVHAHGNDDGQIYFYEGVINPLRPNNNAYVTSLFDEAPKGKGEVICQVFSCHAGSMKAKGENAELSIGISSYQYLSADKNIFFIIHSGKNATSTFLANEYIDLTYKEKDPAKIMLDAIVHYDDTVKFIHDKKVFKSDRLKPQTAQDLTDEKIREFLSNKIDKFLEFFEQKLKKIDATKREELAKEYKEKLTSKHLAKYRGNSCLSYVIRKDKNDDKDEKPYVQAYLEFGKGLIESSHSYTSLLEFLAQQGYKDEVKKLLENYPDIKERSSRQETALHLAVKLGFKDAVKALIEKGIDVNATNQSGQTALEVNYKNDPEILRILVEAGSNIPSDIERNISLHEACEKGYVKVVKAIVESASDNEYNLGRKNSKGETALDIAKRFGQKEVEKILLREALIEAVSKGQEDEVRSLLKEDVDVNFKNKKGETLFHRAFLDCNKDRPQMLKDLFDAGMKISYNEEDYRLNSLQSAIHNAVIYGKKGTLNILFDITLPHNTSSRARNIEDIILGIRNKLPGYARSQFDFSGWEVCKDYGCEYGSKLMLDGTLINAVALNKIDEVQKALEKGACISIRKGEETLNIAVAKKDIDLKIIKALLETGIDLNYVPEGRYIGLSKKTPLYSAVEAGNSEVVEMLLGAGSEVMVKSEDSSVFRAFFKPIGNTGELKFVHQPEILKLLIENLLHKGSQDFSKAREEVIELGEIFEQPQFIEKFDKCAEEILPSTAISPTLAAVGVGRAAEGLKASKLKSGSSETSKSK